MSTCWQVWQFGADGCHIMHTKGKILQLSKGYWIKYVNSGDEHGYSGGTSVNVEELYIQLRWWNVKKTTLESAKKSYSNFQKLTGLPWWWGVLNRSHHHQEDIAEVHSSEKDCGPKKLMWRETEEFGVVYFRKEADKTRHDRNMKWNLCNIVSVS